jgi:aminomethyltransferase
MGGMKTSLYNAHLALKARMVEFAGYEMPLHYGSQIEEHHAVRRAAGVFDVSHMGVLDVEGPDALPALCHLLASNPVRLKPGRALYSCLLNEQGGVMDDLIVYRLDEQRFRLVVNAANKHKDVQWIRAQLEGKNAEARLDEKLAILSLQGPESVRALAAILQGESLVTVTRLKRFGSIFADGVFFGRTGYTGEDGFEIIADAASAPQTWDALITAGVRPIGLGARDTLRLEAGLNLCGADMDESVTPLECGLGWTVAWEPAERNFIGRKALEQQRRAGVARRLLGLRMLEKGVLRAHQSVFADGLEAGTLTSGAFAPTLGYSIGLARVGAQTRAPYSVEIRGRHLPVEVVEPPFVTRDRSIGAVPV